jgi:hypothetical protein
MYSTEALTCSDLRPLSPPPCSFSCRAGSRKSHVPAKDSLTHSSVVLRLDKPCRYWPSEQCVCIRGFFRIEFVRLSNMVEVSQIAEINKASSRMQLSPEVKAMKQRHHDERLIMVFAFWMYLSSISLFGVKRVVTQSSHDECQDGVACEEKLRWSFQKLSMSIARMSCPRPGTSAYPTQTPSLLGQLPTSSPLTQFLPLFRSSTPFHLIANSLKAKRSIPTLHSKRLSRASNDKYQGLGALGRCD